MNLKQLISSFIVKLTQKFSPNKLKVLGLTLEISKNVFNPKFYYTSKFMAENLNIKHNDLVLDIGTGSGIQAIVAAQKAKKVIAIDINPEAVKFAKKNIKLSKLNNIRVLEGDLFLPLSTKTKFDIILFTPPYFEGKLKTPFDHSLYDPQKKLAKRFFKQAKNYLKKTGHIQMIYSSIANPKLVLKIANNLGWKSTLVAKKKLLFETLFIYKFVLK